VSTGSVSDGRKMIVKAGVTGETTSTSAEHAIATGLCRRKTGKNCDKDWTVGTTGKRGERRVTSWASVKKGVKTRGASEK